MKLGERIKERRKELFLTQKELGDLIQVTQKQISKYERNDSIPSLEQIEKLANALKVPIGYFVYETASGNVHTGEIKEHYKSPYKITNIANKPPENEFSKQQQEMLNIMQPMTEQEQIELLGAIKMYLSTRNQENAKPYFSI